MSLFQVRSGHLFFRIMRLRVRLVVRSAAKTPRFRVLFGPTRPSLIRRHGGHDRRILSIILRKSRPQTISMHPLRIQTPFKSELNHSVKRWSSNKVTHLFPPNMNLNSPPIRPRQLTSLSLLLPPLSSGPSSGSRNQISAPSSSGILNFGLRM